MRKSSKKHLNKKRPSPVSQLEDIDKPESAADAAKESLKDFLSNFKRHKSPGEKPPSKVKPRHLLAAAVIVCALLILGSSFSTRAWMPFRAIASVFVVPAQKGVNSIGLWFSDRAKLAKTVEEISAENDKLKQKVEDLERTNTMLKNQSAELLRMQELTKLQEVYKEYPTVGASVIAKDSGDYFATFTINKGSKDGIKVDMNVIASGGLVGIVTDVGYNYATVRSIIDDDSSVSAQFQLTQELCIVNGSLELMKQNVLGFSNVNLAVEVEEDMAVVTSRISTKYLPGLLIGYVSEYSEDANKLTKSGYITPAADFTNLSEVLVITELKSEQMTDYDENETQTTASAEASEATDSTGETTPADN